MEKRDQEEFAAADLRSQLAAATREGRQEFLRLQTREIRVSALEMVSAARLGHGGTTRLEPLADKWRAFGWEAVEVPRLGVKGFAPTGRTAFLLDHFGLSAAGIADAALQLAS